MDFHQQYRTYVELKDHRETYELMAPTLSIHNLIVGTPYIDIGGRFKCHILGQDNLKAEVRFHKRGWFSSENQKCEGEISEEMPGKSKKRRMLYKIHGQWSGEIFLTQFLPD